MVSVRDVEAVAKLWSKAWSSTPSPRVENVSETDLHIISKLFSNDHSTYIAMNGHVLTGQQPNVDHLREAWWAIKDGAVAGGPWPMADDSWTWLSTASVHHLLYQYPEPPDGQRFLPSIGIAEVRLIDRDTISELNWQWGPVPLLRLPSYPPGPPKIVYLDNGVEVDPWSKIEMPPDLWSPSDKDLPK